MRYAIVTRSPAGLKWVGTVEAENECHALIIGRKLHGDAAEVLGGDHPSCGCCSPIQLTKAIQRPSLRVYEAL